MPVSRAPGKLVLRSAIGYWKMYGAVADGRAVGGKDLEERRSEEEPEEPATSRVLHALVLAAVHQSIQWHQRQASRFMNRLDSLKQCSGALRARRGGDLAPR